MQPWASKPAGPLSKTIAGFMCFHNDGSSPISIVGASSDDARSVEIHKIVHEQGIVTMMKKKAVEVPANGRICFTPESLHFMFIGIVDSVHNDADINLTVDTNVGGQIHVTLPFRGLGEAR